MSDFLAELSPMRSTAYWHDFIAQHLLDTPSVNQNRSRRLSAPVITGVSLKNSYNQENNNEHSFIFKRPSTFIKQEYSAISNDSFTSSLTLPRNEICLLETKGNEIQPQIEKTIHTSLNKSKPPVPPKPAFLLPCYQHSSTNIATFTSTTTKPKMQVPAPQVASFQVQSQQTKQQPFQRVRAPSLIRTRSESTLGVKNCSSPALLSRANSIPNKPQYNSSSFYDPRTHPTIEQQAILCREIAKQLVSDASNAKSKGREMFERRVEKSVEWITTESGNELETETKEDFHERTISDGPVNLRKLLDPRHVEDINTVPDGVNEHFLMENADTTRYTCKNIVQDLLSPEANPNRGNALFTRRAQKSNEWIVEDVAETVIDAARDKVYRSMIDARSVSPTLAFATLPKTFSTPPPLIPGPVFDSPPPQKTSLTPEPNRALAHQFHDFNARIKPFCRAF